MDEGGLPVNSASLRLNIIKGFLGKSIGELSADLRSSRFCDTL